MPFWTLRRKVVATVTLMIALTFGWAAVVVAVALTGAHDEARSADAIAVLGAAQYNGRPSPVFRARLESRRVYTGRVVRVDVDTVRFPDGSTGELEIIRHPGAAAIVPCASDPQGDPDPTILLIRQFRYAAGGPLWEIPAGTLDPGEDPEACAR